MAFASRELCPLAPGILTPDVDSEIPFRGCIRSGRNFCEVKRLGRAPADGKPPQNLQATLSMTSSGSVKRMTLACSDEKTFSQRPRMAFTHLARCLWKRSMNRG